MHPNDESIFSLLIKEAKLPTVVLAILLTVMITIIFAIYFLLGAHLPKAALFLLIFITSLFTIGGTILYVWKGFIIVPEQRVVVVERLGKLHAVYPAGPHIVLPFIDKYKRMKIPDPNDPKSFPEKYTWVHDIDLRGRIVDLPSQMVLTKNNVSVEVDSVVYYQIKDPQQALYKIDNVVLAMEELVKISLRDVIGEISLQDLLADRETMKMKLKKRIADHCGEWGIIVQDVGLQNVRPPKDFTDAMSKNLALVEEAEARKTAAIRDAEGQKQAAILQAEGEQAQIDTYKDIDVLVKMKYFEALGKIADGNATKVFLPFPNEPGQAGLFSNVMNMIAGAGEALATKDFKASFSGQTPKTSSPEETRSSSASKPEPDKSNVNKPVQRVVRTQQPAPPKRSITTPPSQSLEKDED